MNNFQWFAGFTIVVVILFVFTGFSMMVARDNVTKVAKLTAENERLWTALKAADFQVRMNLATRRIDGPTLLLLEGSPAAVVVRGKPHTLAEAANLGYRAIRFKGPEGWQLFYNGEAVAFTEPEDDLVRKWAPQ